MKYAILCPVGLSSDVVTSGLIGGNYLKSASGHVYVAGFGQHNASDSETHVTISVDQLPAFASQLPTLGKSVAISGIENPEAFLSAFGMVRCDENGNELMGDVI